MQLQTFIDSVPVKFDLSPEAVIAATYAKLSDDKKRKIKPEQLRSEAEDCFFWNRDQWIASFGIAASELEPGLIDYANLILDATYAENHEYASTVELGDEDTDAYTLGFCLAVIKWQQLCSAGQIRYFDWTDEQIAAWIENQAVAIPDATGQFRLF